MIRENDKIDLIENIQLTGFREEMIQDFIKFSTTSKVAEESGVAE